MSLETVKKVAEFAEQLDTNKHKHNNILTNLCTGLETFLGFDPSSKGYTGDGIVYSDLDRLCDGVMGFLSGVLSNIYSHLGQHKGEIGDAISILNKNKHAGKKGFNAAIGEVVDGVRGYNERVKRSNDDIKNPIRTLLKYVKAEKGTLLDGLNDIQVPQDAGHVAVAQAERQIDAKLEECKQNAQTFINNLDTKRSELKTSINDLNSDLKNKLENVRRTVEYESERLGRVKEQETEELKKTIEKIGEVMKELKVDVDCTIGEDVKKFVDALKEKVTPIKKNLEKITTDLAQYIRDLADWMVTTKNFIEDLRNSEMKKILNEAGGDFTSRKLNIEDAVKLLDVKNEELGKHISYVKKQLDKLVKAALGQVKEMDGKLKEDLYKVKKAVEGQVEVVKNKIGELCKALKGSARGEDAQTIAHVITAIFTKVQEIQKGVIGPDGNADASIDHNWRRLEMQLQIILRNISGDRKLKTGLEGIEQGIKDYVQEYCDEKQFRKKIDTWIDSILTHNEMVKQKLSGSVENRYQLRTGSLRQLHGPLKSRLMYELQDIIEAAGRLVDTEIKAVRKNDIQGMLTALKTGISHFVEQLAFKLSNYSDGALVQSLTGTLAQPASASSRVGHSNTTSLTCAAETVLAALHATGKQHEDTISKLIMNCRLGNVNEAMTYVDKMKVHINGKNSGDDNFGQKIDLALQKVQEPLNSLYTNLKTAGTTSSDSAPKDGTAQAVDVAIEGVTETLKEEIGRSDSEKVTLPTDAEKFKGYRDFVDQTQQKLADAEKLEGSLPAAITNIGTESSSISVVHITAGLTKVSSEITKHLGHLTYEITEAANVVNFKLGKLKDDIIGLPAIRGEAKENSLQRIHDKLDKLQSPVITACKGATYLLDKFLAGADKRYTDIITDHVKKDIQKATEKLTTHARRQYVSSIDALLRAFAKKTESELTPLLIDVNNDLNIGLKGFMKKFHEKFVGSIEAIGAIGATSIEQKGSRKIYPLSQATNKFNAAMRAFFYRWEKQTEFASDYQAITPAKEALRKVLAKLVQSQYFDDEFCNNLDALTDELNRFAPGKFGQPTTVLSQAFKEGFADLASVLRRAYVSRYDGASDGFLWTNAAKDHKLTDDAMMCANVCWSILPILHSGLTHLRDQCSKNYPASQIHLTSGPGVLLTNMGYDVAKGRTSQDGQLRNMETMMGEKMARLLAKNISGVANEHLKECITKNTDAFNLFNVLECLYTHLNDYYSVRHLVLNPRPRMPCNIFEMLCWMSGLPCTSVYEEMCRDAVSELFVDPEKQVTDGELTAAIISDEPIVAYPHDINYNPLLTSLTDICSQSHDILTTILGTGDSYTIYAVDYSTNSLGLRYPSTGEDCLQMLLDILRRLFPVLRFMYTQCGLSAAYRGWYDCQYGKNVKYSNWNCREHSAEQQLDCYPTSPLMSYLRDCLPGLLPHRLTNIGCKSVCANSPKSTPGQPCLTPLGFRNFSGSTKTGKELCKVLAKFFDSSYITSLFCLTPKPPSTLSEHFEFALSLAHYISTPTSNQNNGVTALREAFEENITGTSIELYKVPSNLTDALRRSYYNTEIVHSAKHSDAKNTDLSSLASKNSCSDLYSQCAPYLCSTSSDAYRYLAKKHAGIYLSWAVYLPWTFYSHLKSLLDAFQQIDCGGSGCTKCSCKPGKHGVEYSCKCNALISCRGVMTTFYQYGFTFGNAKTLYGTNRKFCLSFSTQLSNLLKSQYFKDLFTECDNFIWTIRAPFIWLNVALWSLSLFYLICVMVGRLDVLHIKSHLRVPSSHKITAQSLLAAAQVGRLAKISYLQP